jgi:L-iditol 2-dehydrogenase
LLTTFVSFSDPSLSMKALVLTGPSQFEIQDVAQPEPGPGEVLIKVMACGICGSDVHGMDGSTGRRQPPVIMGHEASGEVAGLGEGVTDYVLGDRVTFDSTVYCGECSYCQAGKVNLCENRNIIGVSCDDYNRPGAFAEYLVVPTRVLYRFGPSLDFAKACMVEPLSIAFHAVSQTDIPLGASVVVVGAGIIGQMVVQTVRRAGCGTLIVADLEDSRLAVATKHGADHAVNSGKEDLVARVKALTGGMGADIVLEAVGAEPTIRAGVACLRKGGAMTVIGNIAPNISFPMQEVVTRELRIQGTCASAGEYPACLEFLERGWIDVSDAISEIVPLERGPEMFERLHHREAGLNKVILQPQEVSS